ncbi:MAG TPA: cobaltochelatase subunit CobN, partial [Pyrinomonadaceae bacterium]|nr:cobaltochelatase subunit CobN [Pyrinomonadaceae bacterium]
MKVTVLHVGSSLLAPLRNAEREINQAGIDLSLCVHNFGSVFTESQWLDIENDLSASEVVFVIHVMDGENASRLLPLLDARRSQAAVVVINCMPELMRRTHIGKLNFAKLPGMRSKERGAKSREFPEAQKDADGLVRSISSWIGKQARDKPEHGARSHSRADYLKWVDRLPTLLRFVPKAGRLRDAKNYLLLVSYFLQPTPNNIRSMILLALKEYASSDQTRAVETSAPESVPAVAIYHPDAPELFKTFEEYEHWYSTRIKDQSPKTNRAPLNARSTLGLLLMRPQIVSDSHKHYDALIRAIEAEGLEVIPAIATLMDNRDACERFFVKQQLGDGSRESEKTRTARVSQIVSLTGFSFVGGPAMNDSEAATKYLSELNVPYRSLVSLDTQTIESWRESFTGLNPVQTGMQIAIPEIDGATEPHIFGGIPERGVEPSALEDRCRRIARRLKRWNRLQVASRADLKIALVIYCFPPNKGNIGTAADLDVIESVRGILKQLQSDGYEVEVPPSADGLRELILGGDSGDFQSTANVAYRLSLEEYRRHCSFVDEIEKEWGAAPGKINSNGEALFVQGVHLGKIFVGVQPTFGYEDDPMRLLMSKGGAPHHGFAAFYSYLQNIFKADAVVHVGTHGALEFMPGKQVGLSSECWPDRLIGELPNVYIYSVNNPSEGTIAKR